jgi:hypothetical protein
MEWFDLNIVYNCLNTKIYSYLEASGGQSSNLYFYVVHFSTPVLIRHLWQHLCLNTKIYSYLETSGGQSPNLYLNVVHFFNASVN